VKLSGRAMASRIAELQAKLGGGAMIMGGMKPGGAPPLRKKRAKRRAHTLDHTAVLDRAGSVSGRAPRKKKAAIKFEDLEDADSDQFGRSMVSASAAKRPRSMTPNVGRSKPPSPKKRHGMGMAMGALLAKTGTLSMPKSGATSAPKHSAAAVAPRTHSPPERESVVAVDGAESTSLPTDHPPTQKTDVFRSASPPISSLEVQRNAFGQKAMPTPSSTDDQDAWRPEEQSMATLPSFEFGALCRLQTDPAAATAEEADALRVGTADCAEVAVPSKVPKMQNTSSTASAPKFHIVPKKKALPSTPPSVAAAAAAEAKEDAVEENKATEAKESPLPKTQSLPPMVRRKDCPLPPSPSNLESKSVPEAAVVALPLAAALKVTDKKKAAAATKNEEEKEAPPSATPMRRKRSQPLSVELVAGTERQKTLRLHHHIHKYIKSGADPKASPKGFTIEAFNKMFGDDLRAHGIEEQWKLIRIGTKDVAHSFYQMTRTNLDVEFRNHHSTGYEVTFAAPE